MGIGDDAHVETWPWDIWVLMKVTEDMRKINGRWVLFLPIRWISKADSLPTSHAFTFVDS